jgi:hypothetical protein
MGRIMAQGAVQKRVPIQLFLPRGLLTSESHHFQKGGHFKLLGASASTQITGHKSVDTIVFSGFLALKGPDNALAFLFRELVHWLGGPALNES